MFDVLINAFQQGFRALFDASKLFFRSWFGVAITLVTSVFAFLQWLADQVENVGSFLVSTVIPGFGLEVPGVLTEAASWGNTFAPLSEAMVCLIAWGAMSAGLQLYRFLKSWLPTVSG